MKPRGLFIALAVLVILAGGVWWSNKHPNTEAKSTPAAPKILSVPENQIQEIRLAKSRSEPIVLAKLTDKWEILQPKPMPADQEAVNSMTSTVSNLSADRLIDEHPANLNEFGLTNPTEEIDIKHKDGMTSKLLLGSDTPTGGGTYAKLENDPKVYTLPSYSKSNFDKSVNDLRDKRLLTFNQDKISRVDLTAKGQTIEFGKNGQSDWQIVKPKPLRADNMQVDDLVRKLKDAKMDLSSADDAKQAAAQFASGARMGTASVTDNTGTQTIEVRKATDKNYYAKSSVVDGIYKVANDLGEGLDKGIDDFRNKKLFDFGFTDPSRLEINGTAYQKSGDKWNSGSTQYDAGSIQSVIDKLRDLSAAKFEDKLAGTQTLTVGVTSGDNKRNEKVTIYKNGDSYDAQREGEPAVYVVEAKPVDELNKTISGIKPYQAPKNEKKK